MQANPLKQIQDAFRNAQKSFSIQTESLERLINEKIRQMGFSYNVRDFLQFTPGLAMAVISAAAPAILGAIDEVSKNIKK